jgi:hypothetical protein
MILCMAANAIAMFDIIKKLALELTGDDFPINGRSEIGSFEASWK